ncbi:MAG: pyridoxal-dependent decarboxylase [Acidobacteriota bacterium]|nr:pyridoxal-dependent decarboxylase [Acidobacteriota bacterium]
MQHHQPERIAEVVNQVRDILTDYYAEPTNRPPIQFHSKADMIAAFDEPIPPAEGIGLTGAIDLVRDKVLPTAVKTWHPLFLNQMFPGASMPSLMGEMLASMMNPTLATWEMSPSGTIIERNVIRWMARLLGLPEGSGGILLPGGSISNLLALTVARNTRLDKDIALKGMAGVSKRGAILCSDASHYSVANSANLLGIGKEQVIKVATNHRNEMLVDDLLVKLDECDTRGLIPFALVATMGITVTGGFDPLDEIAPICRERNIHLHVDAAFGGLMSLSHRGQEIFKGVEYADSAIWDAHKWMQVPLTCTALMVPDPKVLKQVFSSNADYLYHPQMVNTAQTDDLGQYTILCGKRFDSLCLWMLMKAFGENHYRNLVNARMEFMCDLTGLFNDDPDFQLSYEPRSPLACFQFRPPSLEDAPVTYRDNLHRWVRDQSQRNNLAMYNIARLKNEDHFRAVFINPLTTVEDMRNLLEEMRNLAYTYLRENPR